MQPFPHCRMFVPHTFLSGLSQASLLPDASQARSHFIYISVSKRQVERRSEERSDKDNQACLYMHSARPVGEDQMIAASARCRGRPHREGMLV